MEKVTVAIAPFRLHQGAVVGLTPAQAAPRAHNLRATAEPGVYEVAASIEFKAGESLLMDTEALTRGERLALDLESGPATPTPAGAMPDDDGEPAPAKRGRPAKHGKGR